MRATNPDPMRRTSRVCAVRGGATTVVLAFLACLALGVSAANAVDVRYTLTIDTVLTSTSTAKIDTAVDRIKSRVSNHVSVQTLQYESEVTAPVNATEVIAILLSDPEYVDKNVSDVVVSETYAVGGVMEMQGTAETFNETLFAESVATDADGVDAAARAWPTSASDDGAIIRDNYARLSRSLRRRV